MENESQNVVITNIKMPFFSMVIFMIKWVFALIPALIIIALLWMGLEMAINMLGLEEMLGELMPSQSP
ncbi:MAG: hypothetical protein KAI83_16640 [Thiomargarita sp.]|nr:hypothetical protein [Thiomargarita sp.]